VGHNVGHSRLGRVRPREKRKNDPRVREMQSGSSLLETLSIAPPVPERAGGMIQGGEQAPGQGQLAGPGQEQATSVLEREE